MLFLVLTEPTENVRKRAADEIPNEIDIKYRKLEEENIKLKNEINSLKEEYEKQLNNQAHMFKTLIEKEKNALKQKLFVEQNKSLNLKKKKERIKTKLENVIEELRNSKAVSNEMYDILSSDINSVSSKLFENECKNENKEEKGRRYSEDIKRFALTLHYHSPKAYQYCRSACVFFYSFSY